MFWLIICIGLLCALFYYYYIRPLSYWKKLGVKQGNQVWFFGDNLKMFLKKESVYEYALRQYDSEERYSGTYQMTLPVLLINDPELIKNIAVKDFDHFVDHMKFAPEGADPLWNRNLFGLRGERWREMRPVLSPAFTSSKMKTMFVLMKAVAEDFIDYYKGEKGEVFELEMKDTFNRFANDVIASAAFGIEVNSSRDRNHEFYILGKQVTNFDGFWTTVKMFGYSMFPKLFELLNISVVGKHINNFFISIVNETIRMREENGIVRPDMIHLLLEARRGEAKPEESSNVDTGFATVEESNLGKAPVTLKKDITNIDIAANALIFFFAGFESVASTMDFMSYELALHPDIQTRLRDEIEETHQACNGKLTYEALMKMKYLDMVVSETLRKWPSNVFTDRVCTKQYTIKPMRPHEKPLELHKGSVIWISTIGIHRDPKNFPEPEKFNPERFSDDNKSEIKPYTYMPFGVGPRNCIGSRFALMECKILFYYLLLNFELFPNKKTSIPAKINRASFNLGIEGGNWLGLKRISK